MGRCRTDVLTALLRGLTSVPAAMELAKPPLKQCRKQMQVYVSFEACDFMGSCHSAAQHAVLLKGFYPCWRLVNAALANCVDPLSMLPALLLNVAGSA